MNLEYVAEEVRSFFEGKKLNVEYVILFGSLAGGYSRFSSDIDLGLRVRRNLDRIGLVKDVVLGLAPRLGVSEDALDIVVFNSKDLSENIIFFYEVLARGVFVWGDKRLYLDDLVRVSLLYADYRIQLRKAGFPAKYVEALGRKV